MHDDYTAFHWGLYRPELQDGKLVRMQPFPGDSNPSTIGNSVAGAVDGAARIRRPAVRKGYLDNGPGPAGGARGAEPFVEVAWDTALELVAAELQRVIDRHGNPSIFGGSYGWASAGRFHHAQSQVHRFLKQAGGYTDSVGTYSTAAGEAILPHVIADIGTFWSEQNSWPQIAEHTDLVVAFGGIPIKNSQVNVGGTSDHDVQGSLQAAADAGVQFVLVSPLRTDLSFRMGADWLALRPNTDTALMLGLAFTLVAENLHDPAFLQTHCVGFERFLPYLTGTADGTPKDPDWAAAIAGIDAETIRGLARRMAAGRTIVHVNWAVQRADHGEQPYWMAVALAAMLGQIGLPGGGFANGYGCVSRIGSTGRRLSGPTLPQGRNPVGIEIPVARIADLLLDPGGVLEFNGSRIVYPDVRLVYWAGGNPFHHHQDLNRLVRAWQQPDSVIVHEQYWNALARHADIVLPATTALERNDIFTASRDPVLMTMKQVLPPIGQARDDYAIFSALAERLGFGAQFTEGRDEMGWLRHIYEDCRRRNRSAGFELPSFDTLWQQGTVRIDIDKDRPVFLGAFRTDPAANPLPTPSGRIEIFSETIAGFGYDDCPGHPTWMEPYEWLGGAGAARHPLHLLSNQPSNKLHSQYDHGSNSLKDKIRGREPVLLHPDDAAARGITDGALVRVFNDRGQCLAGAVISDTIRPGVVQMSTGAWYDPLHPGIDGTLDLHGNPNVLTRDRGTSRLAQGPTAHTLLVEIESCTDEHPAVRVFTAPEFQKN